MAREYGITADAIHDHQVAEAGLTYSNQRKASNVKDLSQIRPSREDYVKIKLHSLAHQYPVDTNKSWRPALQGQCKHLNPFICLPVR